MPQIMLPVIINLAIMGLMFRPTESLDEENAVLNRRTFWLVPMLVVWAGYVSLAVS